MRIVFLKSLKDQSGYALYGNPPRWHKVSAENPAPSDAHHVALSHYHVAAVKKLKDSHHASAKSAAEMAAEAKDLGANLQAAASASAAVSGWKAAMLVGKKPTASQQAAFDALPEAKRVELLAAVGQPAAPGTGADVAKKIKIASVGPELDLDFAASASKDDIVAGKVKNLKFDPSLNNEAEAGYGTGVIRVGEKFFALPLAARRHVLAHEQAHYDAEKIGLSVSIDLADAGVFGKQSPDGTLSDGPGGQWKPDEALTESLALYQTDPDHLKQKFPDAYAVAEAYYTDGNLPKSVADKVAATKAVKQAESSAAGLKFEAAEDAIKAKIAAASTEAEKAKHMAEWKALLLDDKYPDWFSADHKDAALAEAIGHLKEDAQQPDLPAEEKAEDAALVEKMEGVNGAEPFPTFADHDKADAAAQEGPKEGDTKQGADGQLVFKDGHWHKVQQAEGSGGTTTTLHHTTDGHNKFWSVTVDGSKVTTHYGKIGTKGSVSTKDFPSEAAAATHAAKLVQQKTGKGYYPVSSVAHSAAAPKVTAAIEDSSLWHQTGPQKGSNPGGKFKDASGQEWYVKTPATEAHVKNEILAAELYKAAGVAAPDLKTVRHHGKLSVASKWVDGLSKGSASDLANNAGATSGFGVDAWLANWDAVGLEFDNLLTAGGGQAVRIDVGGSLLFRAQGEAKGADFGDKVTETKTLLDAKKNPNTAAVFCSMSKEDMEAAVGKVLAVSDEKIKELCAKHAPGTSAEKMALASKLIARKADLAKQFPGAAKAQKLAKFKPDDLSPPPNFLDWGGSGKAGPSSKSFINEANHSASQAIWAAAKTGDPEAVKSLTAPVFDKESGQVTGRVPVLSHPSQWVKGFAQQMLNEIDYQMNPPKKFRFDGGHPLAALDSAYPVAKVGAGGAAKKLGEFLVLGAPGTVDLAPEFKPDPITYKSGKLTQKTFSKAAQAAIAKLPDTQKQAIKAYTGSSYSEMNQSLWAGNPAGEAKAAAEGLHAVGHEITPGTVLSRRLKLSSIDVAQLEKAAGQILQEPAIMSTSIRPSCWTGGKNVSIKLNVGPGVKGLYVGPHSLPGGGALSKNDSEDEVILPPNTRLLVQQVTRTNKKDADGFGGYDAEIIVEVLVLPTKE